ncbi:MAG TPA: 2,3,4,5-tetrahydropyridine-2,6-dicarboxylate N-succinyltransferase, partial [Marinobacter adhaerens]|nr:2,3,4,5-tetrahydropyridine-2,6-dicarboxylate N-succinyltransferase [Marinobacter adhaerens]
MSFAFGIGIGTQNNQGEWLEVFYQQPVMTPDNTLMDVISNALDYKGG